MVVGNPKKKSNLEVLWSVMLFSGLCCHLVGGKKLPKFLRQRNCLWGCVLWGWPVPAAIRYSPLLGPQGTAIPIEPTLIFSLFPAKSLLDVPCTDVPDSCTHLHIRGTREVAWQENLALQECFTGRPWIVNRSFPILLFAKELSQRLDWTGMLKTEKLQHLSFLWDWESLGTVN